MVQRTVNHCDHCNVEVDAAFARCPLCRKPLAEAAGENDLYGTVRKETPPKHSYYRDLLIFLNIFLDVGAVIVNVLTWNGVPWSLAVVAVLACFWVEQRIFTHDYLFGTKVFLQLVIACMIAVTFDYLAGWTGWALGICLPLAILGCNVAIDLYAYWYKSRWKASLLYGLLFAVLGFVPLILYLSKVTGEFIPMVLCLISSVLSLLGMLRFAVRTMRSELRKRLHV